MPEKLTGALLQAQQMVAIPREHMSQPIKTVQIQCTKITIGTSRTTCLQHATAISQKLSFFSYLVEGYT